MQSGETLFLLLVIGIGVWVVLSKRKERGRPGIAPVVFVRVRPPASRVLQNLIVLAVVIGLGWFFWYVMVTRCNGGC